MKLSAGGSSSVLPAVGMLLGMLLLGLAGIILITGPSASAGPANTGAGKFLARRLQGFGYITTSRFPSSFDSSDSSSSGSSLEPSKSSLGSSDPREISAALGPHGAKSLGGCMGWLTLSLLLQLCFAVVYNQFVTDPIIDRGKLDERVIQEPQRDPTDFNNGIFNCVGRDMDRWVVIQGLCCPMVRIAHTNAVSGVCPFWQSLWCWCCCAWMTMNIGPSCLLVWWRMRLKSIMRLEDNAFNDFCITILCPQISACQMGTAVDAALGYQVTGCCHYSEYYYGGD